MKKFRILFISIIIVLSVSLLIFAACDNVPESTVSDEPVAELSSWMSMIEDDTLLTELVIPGSHDSGTKGMNLIAETQDKTYLEQLERGFRYFDTRVMYTGGEFYMYHSVKGEMKYSQVLEDVKAFLDENPTETVILDFQWTEGGNDKGIFDMLEEKLSDKLINVEGESALEFVKALTLGEARGKCLIFVGQNESNLDRPYQIARDKDSEEREGSALRSYYNASYNRSSSQKYIEKYIPEYIEMFKNSKGGMFVLQGQLTYMLTSIRDGEAKHDPNMNAYVKGLYDSDDLQYINIIMRDFVNCEKASYILNLNVAKKLVKAADVEDYKTMLKNYIEL